MEQQNRPPYSLPLPTSAMSGQGNQGAKFELQNTGATSAPVNGPENTAHTPADRHDETRPADLARSAQNHGFWQSSLPPLASFTQEAQSSVTGPPNHLQQSHLQTGFNHSLATLPSLNHTVPRRDVEAITDRREASLDPASYAQVLQKDDFLSEQDARQHDQGETQEVIDQAVSRAHEAGYRPLNVKDALSYLDQVKIQFHNLPDVYNQFLDIMKDFKSQTIDTPGVIGRVSTLFRGHPLLVQGFNTFLPPGYRIECSSDPSNPNPIRVTTPHGTVSQVNGHNRGATEFSKLEPHPSSSWRTNDEQYGARNAAVGMTMVSVGATEQQPNGTNGEKKPVEFNHAINYVNKIKTRFTNEPDTYKHFLEILQTYQKDAKPIHEVFGQVTELFKGAQDLLQDFKQFLPENNASTSNASRLPTVGTFAPPTQNTSVSSTRDRKRRPGDTARVPATKKPKVTHRTTTDVGLVSPKLLSVGPEPVITQGVRPNANIEDVMFFERMKKHLNSKSASSDFLKALNLFTTEVLDKNTLVEKVEGYFAGNRELFEQFKKMVHYTGTDEIFENLPVNMRPKVELSRCKPVGPSYRILPRSETLLPCSGRDDMCREVLNDVYVSHPTWATEDAGFTAHKKNSFEEALHKVEEERYEYDLHIEANLRTIQLLEPIAQRISNMSDEEKSQFKLPPGLGGQSVAIYQKVIKKIYDKFRGQEIIDQLHANPTVVVPVVLKRLKQKDEEWKRAQREWNKVWRESESKNYYKSLDHQGTFFKATDKKAMIARNLLLDIDVLRRSQAESRINMLTPLPRYQYEFSFARLDICLDIQRLMDVQIAKSGVGAEDKHKMTQFNHIFLPAFFGINQDSLVLGGSAQDSAALKAASSGVSTRRKKADEQVDLWKSIIKRTREPAQQKKRTKGGASDVEDIETGSTSRASTPALDERISDAESAALDHDASSQPDRMVTDQETEIWTDINHNANASIAGNIVQPPQTTEAVHRHIYNMYSGSTFFVYLRYFQTLYDRLHQLKLLESEIVSDMRSRIPSELASKLGLVSAQLSSMAAATSQENDRYEQLLVLSENLIQQTLDPSTFEDMLRHIYGTKGYPMYTVDKMIAMLIKQTYAMVTEDNNIDQTEAFLKDRQKHSITPREQITYRIQAQKMVGPNEHLYRSEWNSKTRTLRLQLLSKDDDAPAEFGSEEEEYKYYVAAYTLSKATSGVPQERCQPLLQRNLRSDERDVDEVREEFDMSNALEMKICMLTYKPFFVRGTEDAMFRHKSTQPATSIHKRDKFREWLDRQTSDKHGRMFELSEDAEMPDA